MEVGVKVLDTCGRLGVTVSVSEAVQVPAIQLVAVLVLVTLAGAVMEAVLVIWVCAKDREGNRKANASAVAKAIEREHFANILTNRLSEQQTLGNTNEYSSFVKLKNMTSFALSL